MMARPTQRIETTPLGELRTLIEQADSRIGALETGTTSDALKLLRLLDDIERLYNSLAATDADLRAEMTRRETIQLALQRKAGTVLRLLRPSGGIAAVRAQYNPPKSAWWWYLDEYVAAQRRRALRSLALTGVVFGVVVLIGAIAYRTVLAPDPTVVARLDHLQAIQRAIERDDLDLALKEAEEGLAEFPDDGELLIWRGAILVRLNRPQEAQAAFTAARHQFADEPAYLIQRSTIRLQARDVDGAYADGKEAVRLAPDNAQAHLVLGGVQEVRGEYGPASQSYQKAAELAAAQKQTQLEALAKIRLAMMMQSAPIFPTVVPEPTR